MTEQASSDGSGALVLYTCLTEKNGATQDEVEAVLPAHKAWVLEREAAGDIFLAGPFLDGDMNYAGEGLIVFRADDQAAAEALAATDPMHTSGVRRFRIRPWRVNEGRLSMTFTVSSRSAALE